VNSLLAKYFDTLETQRAKLLVEIKKASSEQINQQIKGKWSVNQIASHLITAEQLSVSYITKKINAINEVGNTGLLGELKLLFFIISQRLPLKYKAPKTLGEQPRSYSDFMELEKNWDETRQQLNLLLKRFSDNSLRKKIYRHPVMGRCNIIHALIFFREHINHHYPQIRRQL